MRVLAVAALVLCAAGVALLAVAYDSAWLVELDRDVAARAAEAPGALEDAAEALEALGGYVVLPLAVVAGVALCARAGRWWDAVFLVAAVVGADLVVHGGRAAYEPVRAAAGLPDASRFPAGHAATAVAIWGALAVVLAAGRPRRTQLAIVAAGLLAGLAVAASRVLLVEQAASDVLAGVLLGVAWLLACALALAALRDRPLSPVLVSLAGGAAIFALLALTYDGDAVGGADEDVARWVADEVPLWVEWAARPFSWLGGWVGLTAIGIVVAAALVRERAWIDLGFLVAAFAGSQLLANGLKVLFDRPRPDLGSAVPLPTSAAFPSGHAAAVACAGAVAVLAAERMEPGARRAAVRVAAVLLGLAIGLSRIALGVHWLSDVAAGWAFGLAWLALCLLGRDLARSRRMSSAASG